MVSCIKQIVYLASVAVVFGQPGGGGYQQYVGKYSGSKQYMDKYTDSGSGNSNTAGFGNYEKYVHHHAKAYEKYMSSADQSSGTGKAAGNIPAYSKEYLDKNAKGFEKYMGAKQGDKGFMTKYAGRSQGGGQGSTDDYSQYYEQYMKQGGEGGGGASGSSSGDYSQYYKKYMKQGDKGGGAQSDAGSKEAATPEASSQSKAKEVAKGPAVDAISQPSGKADTAQKMPKLANALEARQPERVPDATKTSATHDQLVIMSQATPTNGADFAFPMPGFFAVAFMTGFSLTTFAFVRRQQSASEEPDEGRMNGYLLLA